MSSFVSVTRLRVRRWRYLPAFVFRTFQSAFQARRAAGNIAVRLLRDRELAFWTITVWQSEAAMRSFMLASPHRKAMHSLLEWCDEAALAHWTQATLAPPAWPDAYARLGSEGRPSKVRHPSAQQLAFVVPAPLLAVSRMLNFK